MSKQNYVYSGVKLKPETDSRLEAVCKKWQLPKSAIIRMSIDLVLPRFEKSRLPAIRCTTEAEPRETAEK